MGLTDGEGVSGKEGAADGEEEGGLVNGGGDCACDNCVTISSTDIVTSRHGRRQVIRAIVHGIFIS